MLACKSECAPSAIDTALTSTLRNRLQISTLRSLKIAPSGSVDFSSNDFLSLSTSAALRQNFLREVASCTAQNGLGSGGSRLLDGDSEYATRLENDIALFHGAPTGLLFNSGFDANTAFFSCVPQAGDTVIYDELIHASVHEGMRLSRAAKKIPFKHNDVASLEEVICRVRANEGSRHIATGRSVFVAVESVYSMDGDVAKLAEIVEAVKRLCPPGEGLVVVDEAHATGVLGPGGRGLVSQLYLEGDVFARLHTFGKALACGGGKRCHHLTFGAGTSAEGRTAIILCSPLVKQYLVNYARPLIYTTFMPFASLAAIHTSYNFLKAGHTVPVRLILHLHL